MNDVELLIKVSNDYYNGRELTLSDAVYDQLRKSVEDSDPTFNLWDHIVIDEDDRATQPHMFPYTQQKFKIAFYSNEDLKKEWDNLDPKYIKTYKFDGTSVTAYYVNGKLINIITRSDELYGKKKLEQLKNKVPKIVDPDVYKIDFECTCCKEDFPEDTRSNSNGLINSCYKQDEVDKFITAIPFKVSTYKNKDYLKAFELAGFSLVDVPIIPEIEEFDNRFVMYKGKSYPIDGYVVYNSQDINESHMIWKHYSNEEVITTVVGIEWNKSDYLAWVPKVIFDPITIDGRSVSRCASGGLGNLIERGIGVGSKVSVLLANSTIPYISNVLTTSSDLDLLDTCPCCNSSMEEVQGKLRCSNKFCPEIFWECLFPILNEKFKEDISSIKDNSITTINQFIEFSNSNCVSWSIDDILAGIKHAPLIERFKKHAYLEQMLRDSRDEIVNKRSINNLNYWMFTDKQYEVFSRFIPIYDKIIESILK